MKKQITKKARVGNSLMFNHYNTACSFWTYCLGMSGSMPQVHSVKSCSGIPVCDANYDVREWPMTRTKV